MKLLDYIVQAIEDYKERMNTLKTEEIHISETMSETYCGLSLYQWEEYGESSPFVNPWDKDEMKYANCPKCLELHKKGAK